MKVTYNWLKDFLDLKIAPALLAEKLTMAGLEVTSLEERAGDFIIEIEITSNRPDWLSVKGIAREVAAITGNKLKAKKPAFHKAVKSTATPNFLIEVEDKKDCPLYTAKIIENIKVGPSPAWLKERLELVGCRSVNNIVDITNYILFESGEPLHAFDLDKLAPGAIIVRRAKAGERITTIDGQAKILNPYILVIADRTKAVAAAGVMGGKDTEVTEKTRNVLLEAAVFNPVVIRRARQILGLQSESSYRFERGVDTGAVEGASWQAVRLMEELAGARCVLAKASGSQKARKKNIILRIPYLNALLGQDISQAKIKGILDKLGLGPKIKSKGSICVNVPSYRPDLNLEVDLIEEVARISGYENIPKSLPAVAPKIIPSLKRDLVCAVKNILVGLGLNEVITYSLIDRDLLKVCGQGPLAKPVEILNPLSNEQEILSPSLTPGLGRCIAYNLNQRQERVDIFEIANVFSGEETSPREELVLGVGMSGARQKFLEKAVVRDEAGFLHLKGITEVVLGRLGVREYSFKEKGNCSRIDIFIKDEKIGSMFALDRDALDRLDIKNKEAYLLEVSLDKAFAFAKMQKEFKPMPRYPGITRDISLVVKEEVLFGDIEQLLEEKGRPLLREVRVADFYKGQQIPAGYRGLTISCLYGSLERTLTEAEVAPLHNQLCGLLSEKLGATIRQ